MSNRLRASRSTGRLLALLFSGVAVMAVDLSEEVADSLRSGDLITARTLIDEVSVVEPARPLLRAWLDWRLGAATEAWEIAQNFPYERLPSSERAGGYLLAARIADAAEDQAAARRHLLLALADPRGGGGRFPFERDAALWDLALLALQDQDLDVALVCAEAVWTAVPPADERLAAGLLIADLIRRTDAQRARRLWTRVRLAETADRRQRLQAIDGLLSLQLSASDRLELAEEALRLAPEDDRYRQLHDQALQALQPPQPESPSKFEQPRLDLSQIIARAEAALAAGDDTRAAELLAPHLAHSAVAMRYAGLQPAQRAELQAAGQWSDPAVRLGWVAAHGEPQERAQVLRSLLGRSVPDALRAQAAGMGLRHEDAELQQTSANVLIALDDPPGLAGEAWAHRARGSGSAADWWRAVERLPAGHPWAAIAANRGVASRLEPLPPGTVREDWTPAEREAWRHTVAVLAAVAGAGDTEEHLRCRFELAKAFAQGGRTVLATEIVRGLVPHADERRKQLVDRFLRRIRVYAIDQHK